MSQFHVPTRPQLKSFWIVLSLLSALGAAALLWAARVPYAVVLGVAIFAGSSVVGLRSPGIALRPNQLWDRLSRKAGRAARLWLSGVAFLILWIVGLLGARLPTDRTKMAGSGWIERTQLARSEDAHPRLIRGDEQAGAWVRRLATWAWRSGNVWAWSLIPVLVLLRGAEGESRGSLGGNVYTLY